MTEPVESMTTEKATWTPQNPKPTWDWDVFGGGQITVHMTEAMPEPSRWQRFISRVLVGSKWTRR